MEKIRVQVEVLATKTEQVTFDITEKGEHAYLRMKSQFPQFDFIGERTVNLPEGTHIESIIKEYFNPDAFEIIKIKGRCTCDVCNSPEYRDGPSGWPYICAECPYHEATVCK